VFHFKRYQSKAFHRIATSLRLQRYFKMKMISTDKGVQRVS